MALLLAPVLATLALPAPAPVPLGDLTDEAYRFRIETPAQGYVILGPDEAPSMVPDARAAVSRVRGGLWAAIIPEYAPGRDLDAYIEVVTGNLASSSAIEDAVLGEVVAARHHGLDARERPCSGSVDDIDIQYRFRVYGNGDYAFQVLAWGARGIAEDEDLVAMLDLFQVVPGEVEGSQAPPPRVDADGVGWRQRAGVFESALVGVRVEPRDRWRVVAGRELAEMNETADVGFVLAEPDVYCTLTVYTDLGDFAPFSAAGIAEEWPDLTGLAARGEPLVVPLLGQPLTLARYPDDAGLPVVRFHGAIAAGTSVLEVEAWCNAALVDGAEAALPRALDGVVILDEAGRSKLERELLAGPDPQVRFGEGFGLVQGTYRDFELDFGLSKPAGFWRFEVGAQARAAGEGVRMVVHHPPTDLLGYLEVLPWEADDVAAAHASSLVHEWEAYDAVEDCPEPRRLDLAGTPALLTDVVWDDEDGEPHLGRRIVTVLHGGRRFEFAFAAAGSLAPHVDAVDALLARLRFGLGPMIERGDGGYRDHRVGFGVARPGDDWELEPMTLPEPVRALGSGVVCSGPRSRVLLALGLGLGDDVDADLTVNAMLEGIMGELGGRGEPREGTFLGHPAQIHEKRGLLSNVAVAVVPRPGRALIVMASGGAQDDLLEFAARHVTLED